MEFKAFDVADAALSRSALFEAHASVEPYRRIGTCDTFNGHCDRALRILGNTGLDNAVY